MLSSVDEARVLVTGATGQVGTAFRSVIPNATFLSRDDLDLSDIGSIGSRIGSLRPSAVVNCAAYTDVDGAEREESLATVVNGKAVGELAKSCGDLGIPLVTFSTDYVFDGSLYRGYVESDPVNPINAYGRSKLEGERKVLQTYGSSLVVRTSWVVSDTHDNFVATMLRLAASGNKPLRVVDDQRGRPTIAADLAAGTWEVLKAGATGILHMANRGEATWFDLASTAIELARLPDVQLAPCASDEFPRPAARPTNSVLDTERLEDLGLTELPPWRESLIPLVMSQAKRLGLRG